jgi:hypothetical protein
MRTQFATETGAALDAVRTADAEPDVEGLMILAAEGSDLQFDAVDSALREVSVPVFGGVFPEVLHEGDKHDAGVVVAALSVQPDVTVVPGLSDDDTDFEETLPAGIPGDGTAFVLADAYGTRVEDFVSSLFATYGVDVTYLGGGAGSLEMEQQPCLFTNDGLLADAGVLATVDRPTSVGVKHGWEEVAGPLRVTAASGQRLSELDGEPAFEVYRRIVEDDAGVALTEGNFFEVAMSYPFGLSRLEGEKIVRDPFEVTDEGGLTCFGNVPEGEFVHVLRGDPESLVAAAADAYREAASGRAEAGEVLFFDCISRVLYLEDAFTRELDAVGGTGSPVVGALTIGEIANDRRGHLDYNKKTAVAAVMGAL